jgi:protein-tyrosine-phosphatase
MTDQPCNVLFLCTGNSASSIIAEAILNKVGAGRFRAYSAGSHPEGRVHPETLRPLQSLGYDISGFRSKSWDEFAAVPKFDFVFTVCDNAAAEACPLRPGQPMTAHWGVSDPARTIASLPSRTARPSYRGRQNRSFGLQPAARSVLSMNFHYPPQLPENSRKITYETDPPPPSWAALC